ncbi:MAG TPA: phosphoribosylanthranilate isomerase [Bacteroidia bacterium]|jgi:phosphoribosylanthranilate isomerase|nr:phosphoribosylanthranilate isomerase [Bacteroidia bacterium]
MKLKVCGLKNRENIIEVLEYKPDFIGLIFYNKSPRYIGEKLESSFIQDISASKKVGVFVNESEVKMLDIASRYGLDYLQLHGNETAGFCGQIQKSIPVIKAFQIDHDFSFSALNEYEDACTYFLFDSKSKQYGGSGETFNWKKLKECKLDKPFFLSGGIDLDNIEQVLLLKSEFPNLYAVDVNSRFETEPGIKDIAKIKLLSNKIYK